MAARMQFKPEETSVFINYRRATDVATAGRLFDNLSFALPENRIFMDVASLPVGRDFVVEIGARVSHCDVFVIVIGDGWVDVRDERGGRRLDSADDFVRFEIETAIKFGKHIVPLLVDGVKMPASEQLPESIASISKLNAIKVRHDSFQRDCQVFIGEIRGLLKIVGNKELWHAAFREESPSSQMIVAERAAGWEYLLTAQLLDDYFDEPCRQLDDLEAGYFAARKQMLEDDAEAISWIKSQLSDLPNFISPLGKLITVELARTWGAPGVAGDAREILRACRLIRRAVQGLVEWEVGLHSHEVPERFGRLHSLLLGVAARQLENIRKIPSVLRNAVEYSLAHPDEAKIFSFEAVFDLPEGWETSFHKELRWLERG